MKKRLTGYMICFMGLCVVFTTCYYLSYKRALKNFLEKTEERDYNLIMELRNSEIEWQKNQGYQTAENNNDLNESLEVGASDIETVRAGAKYIVESYDIVTNQLLTDEKKLPGELAGLTRDEMIQYVSDYMKDIPISEYEKGLFAYELTSFSKDSVTMRKSYNPDLVGFKYYVAVKDGYIIVYYSDLKTVYEHTRIEAIHLPEEERNRLMQGIYLESSAELYELLESYSS